MDFLVSNPRANLWAAPGMGKTGTVLTVLDFMHNVWGDSAPSLVLGPLRVARDTWGREAEKWEHLRGLEVVSVTGTVKEREAALRRDAQVFATNYDSLLWLRDHLKAQGRAWPFRRVIADESTRLKGYRIRQGGKRAQVLGEVAHKLVKSWWNLTGTPAPNGLKDLWGQNFFIDAGQRLGRTYDAFESRWFGYRRVVDAITKKPGIEAVIFPHSHEEIHARLADCSLTIDPKDWFDLREPIVNVIEVELPPAARAKYRELEKELFARLDTGEEVEVFNAAALSNKCLQFANGAAIHDTDTGAWAPVHDAKLEALESLIEEQAGAALIVAYQFRSDRERILRAFPKAVDLATVEGLEEFRAGRAQIGLGHPQSIGHGIDGLQNVCNAICFFGQDWNLETHDQIIERIGPVRQMQAGLDRPCYIHYLVATGTVDEVVMARRSSKRDVQDLLLNYMKGKR